MVSFKGAFALSSQEVDAATPPGTIQIQRESGFVLSKVQKTLV
jgi:hypothetical protein